MSTLSLKKTLFGRTLPAVNLEDGREDEEQSPLVHEVVVLHGRQTVLESEVSQTCWRLRLEQLPDLGQLGLLDASHGGVVRVLEVVHVPSLRLISSF